MDLEVVGRHTLFFDDDAMAAFVNSSDALVDWNSLQIDRYDVRHLLSGPLPPRQPQNSRYSSHLADSSLESELDHERYHDLQESSDNQEVEDAGNPEDSGGYHAVTFSYGNASDSVSQKIADVALGYHAYQPPFPVPESLAQSLPSTEKEHQIIARTALFVSQHGGQSEIVLRVKQGDNPTFGFLMPDHYLHVYFRFLVDHPELLKSNDSEKKSGPASDSVNGGALSLLGSVYESGDDEDDAKDSKTDNPTSSNVNDKEKIEVISKAPVSSYKEKASLLKRNPTFAAFNNSMKKINDHPGSYLTSMKKSKEPLIIEPPSDIKKLINKIVEFISKNGKQFESALCEQDSEHLRFSFLLPSDQYHPYYLHVLQKAQEPKGSTENMLGNNESDVASYELDRKEKFKMVIPKPKKDVQDLSSKSTNQESGVTLDVASAAAILKAATRGIKNPDLGIDNKIEKNNRAGGDDNSDRVGANLTNEQKLKAERLRRAKMFVSMLKSGNEKLSRSSSSVEPVQSEMQNGSSVAIDGNVLDGSEMFRRKNSIDEHMDKRSKRKYRSRSDKNEDDETEVSHGGVSYEVDSDHNKHRRKEKSRKRHRKKHHRSHRDDSTDSDTEASHHKHSKKKKKKHSSHRFSSSEEEDDDEHYNSSKYRRNKSHQRYSSSEDDDDDDKYHKHSKKKHRSSRRKHEKSDSIKDDEELEPSFGGGAGKNDSRLIKEEERKGSDRVKEELEEGEICSKVKEKSNAASQPSNSVDVPDDLRAKIRAMLLATR